MPTSVVSEKNSHETGKIDKKIFHKALANELNAVHDFRQALDRAHKDLEQRFYENEDVEKLVRQRAQVLRCVNTGKVFSTV